MKTVVGVKFAHQCKVYYFDPGTLPIKRNDGVIVETEQGKAFGMVSLAPTEIADEKLKGDLKKVIRIATDDDRDQVALNRKNEKDALRVCRSRIEAHGLTMKLLMAEYAFDRQQAPGGTSLMIIKKGLGDSSEKRAPPSAAVITCRGISENP